MQRHNLKEKKWYDQYFIIYIYIYYWSKLRNFVTINLVKNRENKSYVKKSHKICISDIYNLLKLYLLLFIIL